MPTGLENYVKQLQLEQLFRKLGASNPETLTRGAEYFTGKEAKKRDRIVIDYFGERGVNRIVDTISELLLEKAKLAADAETLDVGAGSGFFTVKIADKIRAKLPRASFYAMDMTPAMLLSLEKKNAKITSFVGIAENIEGSIKEAREWFNIPSRFDAVFSTLMLHHSIDPGKVFKSLKTVLKKDGKAIVADLCEHHFEEFRTEMGDIHLGFDPERIYKMAHKHFKEVTVDKTPGIRCECSGRAAEIFVAYMQDHS
jgi:SAM-dependent methyltransferase